MIQFILFDNNKAIVKSFKKQFQDVPEFQVRLCDVVELIRSGEIDIIISPANSFGFMDGGIDEIYMEQFNGIQEVVINKIDSYNVKDKYLRTYLPVGSSTLVPTNDKDCPYLLSTPTMRIPQTIRNTDNVYYAFSSILHSTRNINDIFKNKDKVTIAVPGLGTGVGKITSDECASDMKRAFMDFNNGVVKVPKHLVLLDTGKGEYILKNHACKTWVK